MDAQIIDKIKSLSRKRTASLNEIEKIIDSYCTQKLNEQHNRIMDELVLCIKNQNTIYEAIVVINNLKFNE